MKQINHKRRKDLEQVLDFEICPFISEAIFEINMFPVYLGAEEQFYYSCTKGKSPCNLLAICSRSYAQGCEYYTKALNKQNTRRII